MNDPKFQVEIDNITKNEWNNLITLFDDVTIFQTWEYGEKNSMHLSHLVLKYADDVVACAQVRIFKPPIFKAGIAYINHGPLWIIKNNKNIDVLKKIANVLIQEYVNSRKLSLKVNLEYEKTDSYANDIMDIFIEFGYIKKEHKEQHPILTLNNSIEELRKGLDQKWRNQLNIADRNSLEIIEGYEDQYITEFSKIFKSMIFQKKFTKPESIDGFIDVFKILPYNLRPLVILCKYENEFIAGGVFSTLGTTGIYLFGASNNKGRDLKASYLIQWRIILWLLQNGFSRYNLSGINKINNPGTYHFKVGIIKKNGFVSNYLDSLIFVRGFLNKMFIILITKFFKKNF